MMHTGHKWTIFSLVAVLALGLGALVLVGGQKKPHEDDVPASKAPPTARENSSTIITWTPASLSVTVTPGTSTSISASFTSSKNLEEVTFEVSSTLRGFVSVVPTSLNKVRKDTATAVTFSIAPTSSTTLGTVTGTIELVKVRGKEGDGNSEDDDRGPAGVREPLLPIRVNLWQSFADANFGFSFQYPPTMQVQSESDAIGPSVFISDIGDEYTQGVTIRKYDQSLSSVLSGLTSDMQIVGQVNQTYNGQVWTLYTFQENSSDVQFIDAFAQKAGVVYQVGGILAPGASSTIATILSSFEPL